MKKQIFGVDAPKNACTDQKCPFHGLINVKKEFFKGKVVKKDINRSATIEWTRPYYIPKYERYEVRRSRMRAHNPACIDAEVGELVMVARTRPLSKMKHHIIIQVIKKEEDKIKKSLIEKKEKIKTEPKQEEQKSEKKLNKNESDK